MKLDLGFEAHGQGLAKACESNGSGRLWRIGTWVCGTLEQGVCPLWLWGMGTKVTVGMIPVSSGDSAHRQSWDRAGMLPVNATQDR